MSMSPSCQGDGPPNYSAFPYPLESEGWPTQGPPAMSQRVGPSSSWAEELSSTGATHPGQGISLTREGQGLGCDIVTCENLCAERCPTGQNLVCPFSPLMPLVPHFYPYPDERLNR